MKIHFYYLEEKNHNIKTNQSVKTYWLSNLYKLGKLILKITANNLMVITTVKAITKIRFSSPINSRKTK